MIFTSQDWVWLVVSSVFAFVVVGNISSKAGYPRWYGLVVAVPLLNLVALVVFACSSWPIEQRLLALEFRASENPSPVKD